MRKFYMSLTALAIFLGGILLLSVFSGTSHALPRDCENNSIIYCGAGDVNELVQKYNENKTGDLATIYNAYGISASMLAGAKMGEVRKDGTVVVNGEVVATDAMSIGRQQLAGSVPKNIGGKTYYNSSPSTSFRSNSIAAFVFFDSDGLFKAAIITSCGNSVEGKPKPKPSYKCDSLVPVAVTRMKYNFTAAASASGGATIANYTFDFGDGETITTTDATTPHTYDASGTYVATLTVNVLVNGQTKGATSSQCQTQITIKNAAYSCDSLNIHTISAEKRQYGYTLAYTAKDGAVLQAVDVDFGDGMTKNYTPNAAKSFEHTYVKAGNYKTIATLHFNVDSSEQDVKCEVSISTSPEMCALNPQLPKDDARCAPCALPGKEQYPKDSPSCVTPPSTTELPKTGPMDFTLGGLGIGSIVAAGYYWVVSRRTLTDAILSR